jgi:hypothetical protein
MTIVNVGYRSTNFYVVSAGRSRLLVDLGWPGTFDTLRAKLARKDVPLSEIRYGLAQELKLAGVPLDHKNRGDMRPGELGDLLASCELISPQRPDHVDAGGARGRQQ